MDPVHPLVAFMIVGLYGWWAILSILGRDRPPRK
jgi:hypothetical protein